MKSKKFFGVINLLNFILSATFLSLIFYFVLIERGNLNNNDTIGLTVLSTIFLLIITPFNWACYLLHKTYKSSQLLSKKVRIGGTIFYILFCLLTIALILGSNYLVKDFFRIRNYKFDRVNLVRMLFLAITITAVYLCFTYWIVRKHVKTQFANTIVQLGDESNS